MWQWGTARTIWWMEKVMRIEAEHPEGASGTFAGANRQKFRFIARRKLP
jgi:hypothetical protein